MSRKHEVQDIWRMSKLIAMHIVVQRVGGKDASKQFWKYHNESILKKFKPKLQIGSLDSKKKADTAPPPPPAQEKKSVPTPSGEAAKKGTPIKPVAEPGTLSVAPTEDFDPPLDVFGDLVPYADPNWYQSVSHCDSARLTCEKHVLTITNSITHHTTTKAMRICAPKFEHGSRRS